MTHDCDGCDKRRRGAAPFAVERDRDGEVLIAFCFFCCRIDR